MKTRPPFHTSGRRRGFTLTEVLVVTVILGILMSIVIVGVGSALRSARRKMIFLEIKQLEAAFEAYRNDGPIRAGYPPTDFTMVDANDLNSSIATHVRLRFPYYDVNDLFADLQAEGIDIATFNPARALVFWLVGFNPDPEDPFKDHVKRMAGLDLSQAYYEFDVTRLVSGQYAQPEKAVYNDANKNGRWDTTELFAKTNAPYMYLDYRMYELDFDFSCGGFHAYHKGDETAPEYYMAKSFQIISSGVDITYGDGHGQPAANQPYRGTDADNITNFSDGKTMREFTEL